MINYLVKPLPSARQDPPTDTTNCILPKNLQEAAGPDPDIYPAAYVCFLVVKPTDYSAHCDSPYSQQSTGQFFIHSKYP